MVDTIKKNQMITASPPQPGELQLIEANLYWLRMPLPMSLDHINLYMIDEGESWTLIDTGMKMPETHSYWQTILTKYCVDKPISRIIVTHMHPDHVGMAGWLVEQTGASFFMSQAEYLACHAYLGQGIPLSSSIAFYRQCGASQAYIDHVKKFQFRLSDIIHDLPLTFSRLKAGQQLKLGNSMFKIITGEGHTFEHACLYSETKKWLLAGDQVLPNITPNVSVNAHSPDASPLHGWFESLDQLSELDEDTLVLPAHNKPFYGLHDRVAAIKQHHQEQLDLLYNSCSEAKTVFELLEVLFKRKIHFHEMPLAIGECRAHLNHLVETNRLVMNLSEGVCFYQNC